MVIMKDFRARWAPLSRIAFASIADITADFFYWWSIRESANPVIEKYQLYVFIFFIVSAVACGLTLLILLFAGCCPNTFVAKQKKRILFFEMLFGDVPQFVLTSLISYEKGELTVEAAFNLVTSAYNFVLDILESCGEFEEEPEVLEIEEPQEADPEEGEEEPQQAEVY